MLKAGDMAPDFSLEADDGRTESLDSLLSSGRLILYFYPADFTPVCTAEACGVRDMHEEVLDAGLQVVGVSPQSAETHRRFKQRHHLPFPLLYDGDKQVIRAFGVDGPFGFGVRRATFLIDTDKRIKARVVSDLFAGSHMAFIREAIEKSGEAD